ncbi:MAG: tyrosine-type recombinase/integrase [Proteobacteria bacterium]|nr:tyrosine-type recombinase/integrase [Pseudomonadota bacterium]
MALTDTRIKALRRSQEVGRYTDGSGLVLDVRPSGALLWRYRYRIGGKENLFAIGAYPEVSLREARDERDEARKLVRKGIHPAHQRKAEKLRQQYANANTFKAVAEEWLEEKKSDWSLRTYRQRKNLLEKNVYPHIGSLPIDQVTPAHGHSVVKRITQRAPHMAVIARQCFGGISRLAIVTQRASTDLSYALRDTVKVKATKHKNPLRPHEIPRFFKRLDEFPGYFPTKVGIHLMWWTLARPTEVIAARWDEFDLENRIWTIPAERMKTRQPHALPLPDQAVDMLESLHKITGHFEYILPNRSSPKKHAAHSIFVKAFYALGYQGKFTPHGVRVTGRTILGEQGHPKDVLERQLAHIDVKHVRAYDQGDRLETRRDVMQGWADYLDGLCSDAKVTNIGKQARKTK